ncbi:uncharacterized protein VTP21DRAFT_7519 [Calcarisporiella thermophila]|uniref:uncharacterized protein n=1 Tax=Calcarisporiella thermophila TaxID=911321 RepID=UPI00374291C3
MKIYASILLLLLAASGSRAYDEDVTSALVKGFKGDYAAANQNLAKLTPVKRERYLKFLKDTDDKIGFDPRKHVPKMDVPAAYAQASAGFRMLLNGKSDKAFKLFSKGVAHLKPRYDKWKASLVKSNGGQLPYLGPEMERILNKNLPVGKCADAPCDVQHLIPFDDAPIGREFWNALVAFADKIAAIPLNFPPGANEDEYLQDPKYKPEYKLPYNKDSS